MRRSFKIVFILFLVWKCQCCLSQTTGDLPSPKDSLSEREAKLPSLIKKGELLIYEYPDSALAYLNAAMSLSTKSHLRQQHAESKSWAGVAHYVKGEYDQALTLFTDAQRIYRELENHHGLSSSYNQIGLIYQTQKRYDRAIAYHRKGIAHGKIVDNMDRQAVNHFNIGLAYDEMGQYDSALHYLRICLDQSRSIGLHRMIVMSFNRIGKINFHLQQYASARQFYDSALHYPAYQNNWEECFAMAGLAEVYNVFGRFDEAILSASKSLALAKEIDAKWDVVHAAEILSRAYAGKKYYEKAYQTVIMMQAYRDSLFNEEKEDRLNHLHLKENELAQANLEKENALQLTELKQKNFQITTAVLISILMLVIIFTLLTRHREKSKINKQLEIINREIEQKNKDLNEMNQAKNQLLSIISHDLRGPFAALQGVLGLVRSEGLEKHEQEKLFSQLEQTFLSVSGTLESLLQWAHSQMKGLHTTPERLNIDEIIEKTYAFWEPTIREKKLEYKHTPSGYQVFADPYQMKTAVRNVLGNAIKFTQPCGTITVDTVRRGNQVGIIVSDSGVGMPANILDNLFKFEKKNQRPGTQMERGSGVGLVITQQLLEKGGGSIEVESEEGKGTTFTLWIPSVHT